MRISCDHAEKLMVDYLDGTLDAKDRKNIEDHIKACSACRQNLQTQQEWLEKTAPLLAADPMRTPALDLSEKIKAAVQAAAHEAENEQTHAPVLLPVKFRPVWQKLLATAAAVVILAVSVQVFLSLYDMTFNRSGDRTELGQDMTMANDLTGDSDMGIKAADDGEAGVFVEEGISTDGAGDIPAERAGEETTIMYAAENWQIYTGSLADLLVGSSLFIRPEDEMIDPEDPAADPDKLQQPVIDLLCQASAIRVLTREGPPAETMIMAFWPEEEADEYFKLLTEKSVSWPYTVSLTKVSAGVEQLRLRDELGAELAGQIFNEIDLAQWVMIKIRIGE